LSVEVDRISVMLGSARAVQAVSLEVGDGEWAALIGPNGAGKTTILRALAGLVSFAGSIHLDGEALATSARRAIARRVAFVPQSPRMPPELTVAEYVLLGRTPHLGPLAAEGLADRLAAERAMARLKLRSFADRLLGSLSGGERQRVTLARALAQEAPILLLDEPTSALDLGHRQQALELIDSLRRGEGLTVISAMHDLNLAGQYADRLLLLDNGQIVAQGSPAEVLCEERLATHYDASVRVIGVFVLPHREAR
jgi:iron complex transport system ATP-binding protein